MNRYRTAFSALAFLATAGIVQAQQAFISTFLEPNHPITQEYHQFFADNVTEATGGEISFEVFVGGALVPAVSQLRGVADGLAQVAIHGTFYTPSELPVSNALGDIGFRLADEMILAIAFTDFMTHDEAGYRDWRDAGVVFGAGFANPPYRFLCRENLSTLDEVQGKKVRTPGGGWARVAESIGMVPVNIPSSEIYTGLERGALDCACADVTHLISGATILELAGSVLMVPLSPQYNSPGMIFNEAWWQGMTDEQRRIVFDEAARSIAHLQITFASQMGEALAAAREAGIAVNEPAPDLAAAIQDWIDDGVGGMADVARSSYGIEDPEALYASFQTYIDKWEGLIAGIDRMDEDALTELIQVNLYDTLDVSTYGMD